MPLKTTLRVSFLASLLALPLSVHAKDLLRIYELASKNDANLRAAGFARDAALEAAPQAKALLLPQIAAGYDYVVNDSEIEITYTEPTTGTAIPYSRKNDGSDKSLSITLKQPLFDLESWNRLKQANEQVALAELSYKTARQALLLKVAEAYFGVLGARDVLRSARTEKQALAQQLELAKQNLEVGISSVTDTEEVQARYDLSVASALEAEQALATATEALEEISREPLVNLEERAVQVVPLSEAAKQPLAALREDLPLPSPKPASAQAWVTQGLLGNLDVLAAKLNFNVASYAVKAAQARHLPTLSGSVNYADSTSESGTLPYTLSGPSYGLRLSLPLFAGGATQSGVRQAVATREQRLAEVDAARRQAERQLRSTYQGVVTGSSKVKALKAAAASSRSALVAVETGLEIGTRTAIDVLNSRQQRYAAERNYEQSRYEYLLSLLRLKALAGQLVLRDLKEVDGLLVGD